MGCGRKVESRETLLFQLSQWEIETDELKRSLEQTTLESTNLDKKCRALDIEVAAARAKLEVQQAMRTQLQGFIAAREAVGGRENSGKTAAESA